MWAVVATWPFGRKAVQGAARVLSRGNSAVEAVEHGIRLVEADPEIDSVGMGGIPNFDGDVELDASIMDGRIRAGAVGGLKDVVHAITVARRVMEKTPFVFIGGEAASRFAFAEGMPKSSLLTERSRAAWREMKWAIGDEWTAEKWTDVVTKPRTHETIGAVVLDGDRMIAAGSSTSGFPLKLPGRVGDAAIIGAGVYATNSAGGAVSTGVGEVAIRHLLSKSVCDLMARGYSPQDSCEAAIGNVLGVEHEPRIALVALGASGEAGAAASFEGFTYCYRSVNMDEEVLLEAEIILP